MHLPRVVKFEYLSVIRILMFLFPVAIVGVRHWGSTLFGLLVLSSLFFLPKTTGKNIKLHREEKILLWILTGYIIVAVLSIMANGWDQAGKYALGTELRFLFIIPVYLVARQCDDLWKYLLAGSLAGVIVSVGFGFYELYLLNQPRARGIYGPLFFGPVLLLMILLQLPGNRELAKYHRRNYLIAIMALLGVFIVIMTGARSAYLALVVGVLISFVYYFKAKNSGIVLAAICLLFVLVYNYIDVAQSRMNHAVTNAHDYISYMIDNPGKANQYGDSNVGVRLELWRASLYLFAENPMLGVGRYNFQQNVQKYADAGVIHKKPAHHAHPHNVFFEALANKGLLGLIAVLMLYFYPLYLFIKTRKASRESAFAGILLVVSVFIFSLTEVAPVYFGNFVSVFMLYLSVIFSWHVRQIHN